MKLIAGGRGAAAPKVKQANSYYDPKFKTHATKILPGEYRVVTDNSMLVTVLGSCVSACLRDARLGIGGMNHFMLPDNGLEPANPIGDSARYGAYAMEVLINELMKLGGRREYFEAKVFGGGSVISSITQAQIGERNSAFVLQFLRCEGIAIAAADLLDIYPRKIYYFPGTGRVLVKKLRDLHNDTILRRERDYRLQLRSRPTGGDVELFD